MSASAEGFLSLGVWVVANRANALIQSVSRRRARIRTRRGHFVRCRQISKRPSLPSEFRPARPLLTH